MKIRIAQSGFIILILAFLANCAVVTSYGRMPRQDTLDKDAYYFMFYYNEFSTTSDIDRYAFGVIEKFMAEQGYESYRIVERYRDNPLLNKVIYKVNFQQKTQQLTAQEYFDLGNKQFEVGKLSEAIDLYSTAIDMDPRYGEAYARRALAYESLHQLDQAISDYSEAIQISPGIDVLYLFRGQVYQARRQLDLAISDFTKVIELNPKPKNDLSYYNRGRAYLEKEQYEQAVADFDRSIEINPGKADYYTQRGYANAHRKKYDLAIADFKKAIKLNIEDDEAYGGLGYVSIIKGKGGFEQAISFLSEVIKKNPKNPKPYIHRSLLYSTRK